MRRMQVSKNANIETAETNVLQLFVSRYLPYWPVFAIVVVLGLIVAAIYLKFKTPKYEVTASILIKDEKRGLDDSKILDALNLFGAKKIVENEIEVLHSRSIMTEIVRDVQLYAPIEEKNGLVYRSAFADCPVRIELENPEALTEVQRVAFQWEKGTNRAIIGDKIYHMNEWVASPWGKIRFIQNPAYVPGTSSDTKYYFSLVSIPKQINDLQNSVEISPSNKLSTVINISLRDEVPQRGEAILNELVDAYNKASVNDKNSMAANTLDFVEKRLELMGKELDVVETGIQQFRTKNGVVDISQQSSQYLQNVSDNDQKLSEMDVQLSALDQIAKYITSKNGKGGLVPTTFGITDPLLSQLLQKLYDTELQYEKLKKTTAEDNPILVSIRNEIDRMKPSVLENVNNQRKSIEAARGKLLGISARYNAMLNTLPSKEKQLVEISREQNIKNNIYSFLLQKKEEAALSFNSAVPDSRILDKAQSSLQPVTPKKWMVYLIALAIPLLLVAGAITLYEMMTGRLLFRQTLEEYTVAPVIGELGFSESNQLLVTNNRERSFITEQFRNLRNNISARLSKERCKTIMVTSSIAGEGKSFIASNLAISFAQAGQKVVLIEADMYKPKFYSVFNLSDQAGLSDYLETERPDSLFPDHLFLHATNINKNFFVIPAGRVPDNPSELLVNGKIDVLIHALEDQFDVVIIDSVPLNPVSDVYVMNRFADITLFVVRHAFTPKSNIKMLDEDVETHHLKNVNIVFNSIKRRGFGTSGYGYSYGYGYSSNHGYGYFKENTAKRFSLKDNFLAKYKL